MRFDLRLEHWRLLTGPYGSRKGDPFGAFAIPGPCGMALTVLADNGEDTGWEHVSVSGRRPPNWEEMCFIKDLFWSAEETVVQFHPPRSKYVNCHPTCLHLWRCLKHEIPVPATILVGPHTSAQEGLNR